MNPDEEEMCEKIIDSDNIITLAKVKGGYDVDCWDSDGNNRWHKYFIDIIKAQAEFDRWI